ncbi:MAG TPA: hypothetical protein VKY27_11285 [Bacteriovoracaceae bacterium]|nr:hypothetical protein [Bacteriovoracaceae bacterium]
MKKAILFLSIFTSTVAMAKIEVDMPKINFGVAKVAASEVCVQGENILTKNEVTFCSESSRVWVSTGPRRSEGYFQTVCHAESSEVLSRPIAYSVKECSKWAGRRSDNICAQYETVLKTIPLNYTYGVYKVKTIRGERIRSLVTTKTLSIPSCR